LLFFNLKHQATTEILASGVSSLLQFHFQMNSEDKLEALWSLVVTQALNQSLRLPLEEDVSLFF
jgi:hypothetical protein